MNCPNCYEPLLCEYCFRYSKGIDDLVFKNYSNRFNLFKSPGCARARQRYEERINEAEKELATLRVSQKWHSGRLAFLKLQDPNPSTKIFKGDVAFVVNGCDKLKIHAHRFILAGKSSVFRRMFDCAMLEKETGLIPIDDATYPVMRAVINYCYTADINFTDEVPPEEVLKVAHKYEIIHLRDVCAEELCGRICEKNLTEMVRFSKRYEAKSLQEASAKYFKEHFDTVLSTVMESL